MQGEKQEIENRYDYTNLYDLVLQSHTNFYTFRTQPDFQPFSGLLGEKPDPKASA